MASILYYSNFCEHSKKLLQVLSKTKLNSDIHFICIDKRIRDVNNKVYIILENGQKIIMPETLTRVPALFLLKDNFNILYGESIIKYLKPIEKEITRQATMSNMEPTAFSFSNGGFCNVMSDNYSFLDMNPDSLLAQGDGGVRQMHNYVNLNYVDKIETPNDDFDYKNSNKLPKELTVEDLEKKRNEDLAQITANVPKQF